MEEQWEEARGVGGRVLLGSSPEHPWCASLQPPMAEGTGPLDRLAQPRCPGKLHQDSGSVAGSQPPWSSWSGTSAHASGSAQPSRPALQPTWGPASCKEGSGRALRCSLVCPRAHVSPDPLVFKSGGMLPRACLKPAEFLAASPGRAVVPPRFLATSLVRIGWVLCILGVYWLQGSGGQIGGGGGWG